MTASQALSLVLAAALIGLAWSHLATRARFRRLLAGATVGNLEQLLLSQQDRVAELVQRVDETGGELRALAARVEVCVQRPRVVRFNAFAGTGSDLSFAVALTDAGGNGVVLSSLYGRDECRVYAKPVADGESAYALSEEERQVLADRAAG